MQQHGYGGFLLQVNKRYQHRANLHPLNSADTASSRTPTPSGNSFPQNGRSSVGRIQEAADAQIEIEELTGKRIFSSKI
jgi:hypothetical protein